MTSSRGDVEAQPQSQTRGVDNSNFTLDETRIDGGAETCGTSEASPPKIEVTEPEYNNTEFTENADKADTYNSVD